MYCTIILDYVGPYINKLIKGNRLNPLGHNGRKDRNNGDTIEFSGNKNFNVTAKMSIS